jgi:hypothetical protein
MTTYAIYAEKSWHEDYSEDHGFEFGLTHRELVNKWAYYLCYNLRRCNSPVDRYSEPPYDITILRDGAPFDDEEYKTLYTEALSIAQERKKEAEEEEKQEALRQKAEKEEASKKMRRATYESLKKEFG